MWAVITSINLLPLQVLSCSGYPYTLYSFHKKRNADYSTMVYQCLHKSFLNQNCNIVGRPTHLIKVPWWTLASMTSSFLAYYYVSWGKSSWAVFTQKQKVKGRHCHWARHLKMHLLRIKKAWTKQCYGEVTLPLLLLFLFFSNLVENNIFNVVCFPSSLWSECTHG